MEFVEYCCESQKTEYFFMFMLKVGSERRQQINKKQIRNFQTDRFILSILKVPAE